MVKIITDSTADLPETIATQYNIGVVPLYISFGNKMYKEGVDISKPEFYHKFREYESLSGGLPTTSQPSSKLSGTCESANRAKKELNKDITVIDSGMVSAGLGLIVLCAARAAKNGKNKEQIIEMIEEAKGKIKVYFTVENLKYLEKGGRIGKAQALVGNILHILPILSFKDGIIIPIEKVRGSKKVLPKYKELINREMANFVKFNPKENSILSPQIEVLLVHADCIEKANELEAMLRTSFNCKEAITTSLIGGVVGSHTGPGTWGIAFTWYY
ncbi:MAG: DegV family protein [Candidatus Stahlbacteria bacterium]|nr:DegV family protein [Candidatus Stahlbacteria bacterium]